MPEKELNHNSNANKTIEPQKADDGCTFDQWVTGNSPSWQRKQIVQLKRYLSIECLHEMDIDTSDECWKNKEVFTLTDDYYDVNDPNPKQWLVGAVCMSRHDGKSFLEWAWIHPFWRNRGLLRKSWTEIQDRFDYRFHVNNPINGAMSGFLKEAGYIPPIF